MPQTMQAKRLRTAQSALFLTSCEHKWDSLAQHKNVGSINGVKQGERLKSAARSLVTTFFPYIMTRDVAVSHTKYKKMFWTFSEVKIPPEQKQNGGDFCVREHNMLYVVISSCVIIPLCICSSGCDRRLCPVEVYSLSVRPSASCHPGCTTAMLFILWLFLFYYVFIKWLYSHGLKLSFLVFISAAVRGGGL